MKEKQILFLLILISLSNIAQNKNSIGDYNWNSVQKIRDSVFTSAESFYIAKNNENINVGDLLERQAKYQTSLFFNECNNGYVYPEFYEYETYIKQVFERVIPSTTLTKKFRYFFTYDSDYGIKIDQLGNVKVNIGSFSYLNNESELAALLSHAYGHFFNNDEIYIDYEKREIGEPNYLTGNWSEQLSDFFGYKELNEIKKKETSADLIGVKYFKNSQYSLVGLANAYKTLKRFEIKDELMNGTNTVPSRYHMDPNNIRLKQAKAFSIDSSNINRQFFLVDSIKFYSLKKIAIHESYNLMFQSSRYNYIIELAFTRYLYEPNNPENLAILIEALRRALVLNSVLEKKQFIIEPYKNYNEKRKWFDLRIDIGPKDDKKRDNYHYIDDEKTSILKYLNKGLLHLRSSNLSTIKSIDLLDTVNVKFTTYKEALNYFLQKASDVNCKPCMMSKVLAESKEPIYNEALESGSEVFDVKDFLYSLKEKPLRNENIYILNMPIIDKLDYFAVNTPKLYADFLNNYKTKFKEITGFENVFLISELPFGDQHKFNSLNLFSEKIVENDLYFRAIVANIESQQTSTVRGAGGVAYTVNRPNSVGKQFYSKKDNLKIPFIAPEVVELYNKYKVKNVYFVDFDIIVMNPTNVFMHYVSGDMKTRAWKFKRACLEGKENVVYEQNILITKKDNTESLVDCAKKFKNFVQFFK